MLARLTRQPPAGPGTAWWGPALLASTRSHIWFDGDGAASEVFTVASCQAPAGFHATASDCDDGDAAISPAADEVCNGIDDDCDGEVDDADDDLDGSTRSTWYPDLDGDRYGDAEAGVEACAPPDGFLDEGTDCDDSLAAINPSAAETCNDRDDNCNGLVDGADAAVDLASGCRIAAGRTAQARWTSASRA